MVRCFKLGQDIHIETQLIQIWHQSFGDSEAYIRKFLHTNAPHMKVVAYFVDGCIASATYLLPVSYLGERGLTDCHYLYAAATLPEHRGKGYFGNVLEYVNENIKEPVILVPASKSLVDYYKGKGFQMWLTEKKVDVDVPALCKDAKRVSAEEYCRFRKQCLQDEGSMLWNDKMLSYIFEEHSRFGGEFFEKTIDGKRELFMCQKQEDNLQIVEMLPSLRVQPPVMVNKPSFEMEKGYFNLTMG